jgi:four helix bundle protein
MRKNNVIQEKSFAFALRIIDLTRYLNDKKEFVISRQILRSGTSIGANVEEAIGCHSFKDFLAKFSIIYKEAWETLFWLKLLHQNQIPDEDESVSMIRDCEELLRIIGSIQKTLKSRIQNS